MASLSATLAGQRLTAQVGGVGATTFDGHVADLEAHGISVFGGSLVAAADAAAARTALDAASAAQGALAETAVQPARAIDTGVGLEGGGNLLANRTLQLTAAVLASLALADSASQPASVTAEILAAYAAAIQRANHTGTQLASTISDFNAVASAAAPVQSVNGATGAVDLSGTYDALGAAAAAQAHAVQRANHTGTQAASTVVIAQNNVIIGNGSGVGSALATGAKGRDLMAMADNAALQTEILARINAATITPAIIAASGKISTTSTAADSIATAGGVTAAGGAAIGGVSTQQEGLRVWRVAGDPYLIFERGAALSGADAGIRASADGTMTFTGVDSGAITAAIFGSDMGSGMMRIGGITHIGGSLPAASVSGRTLIGGGRIDTFERMIARGNSSQFGNQTGANNIKAMIVGDSTSAAAPQHFYIGMPIAVGNRTGVSLAALDGSNNVVAGIGSFVAQIVSGTESPNFVGQLDIGMRDLAVFRTAFSLRKSTTAGQTWAWIYDVSLGLTRVDVGANDSAGTGFRQLRIANS